MPFALTRLTNDYVAYVQREQGCTKSTRYCYRYYLNAFLGLLRDGIHPDDLAPFTPANL
jgi:hypothetical protein